MRRQLRDAPRAEVEEYFDRWVRAGDAILDRFRACVARRNGPAEALDAGIAGLDTLFEWAVEQVRFVDHVPDEDLPLWCLPGPASDERGDPDPASARIADGLARHYGETLVRELPGLRWQIGDEPRHRKKYIDQNWPLLVGHLLALNPLNAAGLVFREAHQPPAARRLDWLGSNAERYREILAREAPLDDEPSFWVEQVDDAGLREDGWRFAVGLAEDVAAVDDELLDALTRMLAAVAGVDRVEHEEREHWLVAGTPDPGVLEGAVRGWIARS